MSDHEFEFTKLPNLAGERFGSAVLAANDEFFAPKEGLIKASAPEWREGVYNERGKWMDGWETRRRREPGYDWAILRLGLPGRVHGVVIDTSFFTGNYPERASIDACSLEGVPPVDALTSSDVDWWPLLSPVNLRGNAANSFAIESIDRRATHLRLNIFPDGGVARLRVHGVVQPDGRVFANREVDLGATENGGFVVSCSDMHYGNPQNMLQPGRSTHMGDGWETKRRRGPGHDWAIIRLARRGTIERIELDTDHYKGNAPGNCMIEYCDGDANAHLFDAGGVTWTTLVAESPVQPHSRHSFAEFSPTTATHVRLNIYPDGGVARFRVFGRVSS
jgi:allantoicase